MRAGLVTPATKLQVLVGHQHQAPAWHFGHVLAQPFDDLLRRHLALRDRLETHDHKGVVGAAIAANKTGDALYRRIGQHRLAEDFHFRLHHAERQAVVATHKTDQLPGVLLRHKGFRHHHIQRHVNANGHQQAEQCQALVPQHPVQAACIAADHALVKADAPALHGVFRARHMGF